MRLKRNANHPDSNICSSGGSSSGLSPLIYNAFRAMRLAVIASNIGSRRSRGLRLQTLAIQSYLYRQDMKIVRVIFKSEHKAMLGHCKMILEDDRGKIAINPDKFDKLITSLRTAVDNDGTLDKEATSYNDIFDAFRLALKFCHYEERID
jgi:hypothetical protein